MGKDILDFYFYFGQAQELQAIIRDKVNQNSFLEYKKVKEPHLRSLAIWEINTLETLLLGNEDNEEYKRELKQWIERRMFNPFAKHVATEEQIEKYHEYMHLLVEPSPGEFVIESLKQQHFYFDKGETGRKKAYYELTEYFPKEQKNFQKQLRLAALTELKVVELLIKNKNTNRFQGDKWLFNYRLGRNPVQYLDGVENLQKYQSHLYQIIFPSEEERKEFWLEKPKTANKTVQMSAHELENETKEDKFERIMRGYTPKLQDF